MNEEKIEYNSKWLEPIFDENGYAFMPKKGVDGFTYPVTPFGWRCQHSIGLTLGKNVDVGCYTYMNAYYGIMIGDNVKIGSGCSIYTCDDMNKIYGPVTIEDDVYIGSHSLILPLNVIKKGSRVPAKSILKSDLGMVQSENCIQSWEFKHARK